MRKPRITYGSQSKREGEKKDETEGEGGGGGGEGPTCSAMYVEEYPREPPAFSKWTRPKAALAPSALCI